jgi:signal transduction histidine kinase
MKPDLAFILDHAGWPAFLVDDSGMIRKANAAAVQVLGTVMEGESALSASIWSPDNPNTAEEFLARLERSSAPMKPLRFRVKGGATFSYDTYVCLVLRDGNKYHLFQLFAPVAREPEARAAVARPAEGQGGGPDRAGAFAGLADSRAIEPGLVQRQKLECALQLTRTVALDFNNALTTILGHTSLILSKLEPSHAWRASLLEVEKSAERAAEIAQDLAEFSHQEKTESGHTPGNLNRVLRHAVEAFQRPATAHILWNLELEKGLFTVSFHEAKLQQAFARLLENAAEAIKGEGRIAVRTVNYTFTEPVVSPSVQLAAGHYVGVEITDTGEGIPADVLPRVFEPFFTTKSPPHRGLGLAWVYGIVTNHGGVVSVNSQPGQGTTVRVFLPAQEKIVKDQATRVEDLRGQETVLFVDDEEMLLNLGRTVLTAFGYRVFTAASGAQALDVFGQVPGQLDLVITDLVMPGMSGRELMDQLRQRAPALRILCTSGYLRNAAEAGHEHYLRKPFTSHELLRKVKQVLHPPEAG